MKYTAHAPANIAFIKYWGKKDKALRTPLNDSLSMNLSGAFTQTTVEFSQKYENDDISLLDGVFSQKEIDRVIRGLDRLRERAGSVLKAKVVTKNSFPKGAGSAASASGFAALTLSASHALGLTLSERELTVLARIGSGSACRSIPDGFVVWKAADSSERSYAYTLYPHTFWDIADILVVVDSSMKKVSTTDGMKAVHTSPKLVDRLRAVPQRMQYIAEALEHKDFVRFGQISEEDCLDMHAVMESQIPSLFYRNNVTATVVAAVKQLRCEGLPVYFTIDAGPNVHVLCEGKHKDVVKKRMESLVGVEKVIVNTPDAGARLIETHLF